MTAAEILLLILGAAIFVVSFLIPHKEQPMEANEAVSKEDIKELLKEEMKDAKDTVVEMVNETVSYGVEKAERAMERLTNEKISAVSEFSNTVLTDINKNRDEVMFLYDMLNDKHENLKAAVVQVEQVTQQAYRASDVLEENMKRKASENVSQEQMPEGFEEKTAQLAEDEVDDFLPFETIKLEKINLDGTVERPAETVPKKNTAKRKKISKEDEGAKTELVFDGNVINQGNNNERILELHRMNRSNVAIAKELGLGVGEVKLVIDLYEGMK